MTDMGFNKMSPGNRTKTAMSDSTSEGELAGRIRKDSSTASQHSTDELHDLPPIIGAPNSTVAARYAIPAETQSNGASPGQKDNPHPAGAPHNVRSNSLYDSRQSSPSLRRRLKVLIRQKSEPDMLMGRDLGLNSPRMRRMIAPSPPPGDSPRSLSGSDCNSPRIIRKPRSFHGHGSSPRTPKSAENSPLLIRRSMSVAAPQSPISTFPPGGGEAFDGIRQARSHSMGSRLDADPSGPGSPFTMRREVNLRKASTNRLENPNQSDFLPAVNGTSDGCVTQPISSQESRRSFTSDDDSTGFISMETVQSSFYEHISPPDDRYGHARVYHPHNNHQQQIQPQPHPPHQVPNANGWVERNSFTDCSPPPTNSPTRELGNAVGGENTEHMRESFNSSYSSGSAERSKFEAEVSNEEKRRANSLYDIEEAREQTEDAQDERENDPDCNKDRQAQQDDEKIVAEGTTSQRKDDENNDIVRPRPIEEANNNENGHTDTKEKDTVKYGQNDDDAESGGEDGDDYSEEEDSYEESVPEYQKAPISTKMRVKNWLAGLEKSDNNESSSRLDRFLPEIM